MVFLFRYICYLLETSNFLLGSCILLQISLMIFPYITLNFLPWTFHQRDCLCPPDLVLLWGLCLFPLFKTHSLLISFFLILFSFIYIWLVTFPDVGKGALWRKHTRVPAALSCKCSGVSPLWFCGSFCCGGLTIVGALVGEVVPWPTGCQIPSNVEAASIVEQA